MTFQSISPRLLALLMLASVLCLGVGCGKSNSTGTDSPFTERVVALEISDQSTVSFIQFVEELRNPGVPYRMVNEGESNVVVFLVESPDAVDAFRQSILTAAAKYGYPEASP